jgi:hypothetical protein
MVRKFWRGSESEGGQAVVLIAITFLAMLMVVGLAIDAGQLYTARRTMQEAADAGAYAGAVVRYQGGSVAQARSAAVVDTTKNGYTNGVAGFTVIVNVPPTGGLNVGDDRYVEVLISGNVRTSLTPGQGTLTNVGVRGVAGAEPLNNAYAIMALDEGNVPGAFIASNNADIHLTGGGIQVNSRAPGAANSDQCTASRFTIQTPYGTDVVGTGSGCFPTTGDGLDNGQPRQADPFGGFPRPKTNTLTEFSTAGAVIASGVYNVEIGGAGSTTVVMGPGIYVLKRGINASGNADIIGSNVFIFNTYPSYPASPTVGESCGPINLSGNATSTISAMTTTYVAGLPLVGSPPLPPQEKNYINFLVYQDPYCTNDMTIAGNGDFDGTGTIYLPNAQFVFDGNNARLHGSQLVAKQVNLQNGNIDIDFNPSNTVQPILPRLSE